MRCRKWAAFCIQFWREGQIVGGVAQGIGFALYEKVVWDRGRMRNNQMTNYIMPTSADLPPIRVFFEEIRQSSTARMARREWESCRWMVRRPRL